MFGFHLTACSRRWRACYRWTTHTKRRNCSINRIWAATPLPLPRVSRLKWRPVLHELCVSLSWCPVTCAGVCCRGTRGKIDDVHCFTHEPWGSCQLSRGIGQNRCWLISPSHCKALRCRAPLGTAVPLFFLGNPESRPTDMCSISAARFQTLKHRPKVIDIIKSHFADLGRNSLLYLAHITVQQKKFFSLVCEYFRSC